MFVYSNLFINENFKKFSTQTRIFIDGNMQEVKKNVNIFLTNSIVQKKMFSTTNYFLLNYFWKSDYYKPTSWGGKEGNSLFM